MNRRRPLRIGVGMCLIILTAAVWLACSVQPAFALSKKLPFTSEFRLEECTFSSVGGNSFFILEPGFVATFAGMEKKTSVDLTITVTDETLQIGDVETRVVEERELHDGELAEVSRNYFAICTETNSVFYFGEDVDIYEGGEIVSHEGSWRAFTNGAMPGLVMPGIILLGSRYFQELAAPVAADRAEILKMDAEVVTPAGTFENCVQTAETSPLEPGVKEYKFYAPGIGLVQDDTLLLTSVVFP